MDLLNLSYLQTITAVRYILLMKFVELIIYQLSLRKWNLLIENELEDSRDSTHAVIYLSWDRLRSFSYFDKGMQINYINNLQVLMSYAQKDQRNQCVYLIMKKN